MIKNTYITPISETSNKKHAAGNEQEKQVAYLLDRAFKESPDYHVFNNLRFEFEGFSAQIDHLVLSKGGLLIIESKSMAGSVTINSDGEWYRTYDNQSFGIGSPIKQAERQRDLLRSLLSSNAEKILQKMIFNTLQARFGGRFIGLLCVISNKTIIDKSNAPNELSSIVVKTDFLIDKIKEMLPLKLKFISLENPYACATKDERTMGFSSADVESIAAFLSGMNCDQPPILKANNTEPLNVDVSSEIAKSVGSMTSTPTFNAIEERIETTSQVKEELVVCKKCNNSEGLEALSGKFGYYVKCGGCSTNTPLKGKCSNCSNSETKVSKKKTNFTRVCDHCKNTISLIIK